MAQIFVSHSARNKKGLDFINRAFATTNVQAKYEEIEAIKTGKRTPAQIKADIEASNAIFVLLSQHVEQASYTRDWVVSESSTGFNKDVWVLEAVEDSPNLSIVIPRVRHYVRFDYADNWLIYLQQMIASYDDSHVLKAAVLGAGMGGALTESVGGVLAGTGIALLLLALNNKTPGWPTLCPTCHSFYNVHLDFPRVPTMRCPVCNTGLSFAQQARAATQG